MSSRVISSPAQVTPSWLTRVLKANGALTAGAVATFDVDAGRGNWSTNAVLHLHYAAGAQGELPPRLFLKMVNTCLLYTSPSPRDRTRSRMPSSA